MPADQMQAFDTARLHMRPLDAGDEAFYCHLYTDPGLMQHIAAPLSLDAAQCSFNSACTQHSPDKRRWIIHERSSGEAVGLLASFARDDTAEIGVMLIAGAQGRGIATEAMAALRDLAFSQGTLRLLWIRQQASNVPVIGMMQRLGFEQLSPAHPDPVELRWQLHRDGWLVLHDTAKVATPRTSG